MDRQIIFKDSLVDGEVMREILEIFPETKSNFRQRKHYDEYYFDAMIVNISINQIEDLNEMMYSVSVNLEDILIEY